MSFRPKIEKTEEIATEIEPVAAEYRMRLLLSKRAKHDNPVQRVENLERLMAEIDPNRS